MCADLHRYMEPRVDITHMRKAASPEGRVEEPALVIMRTSTRTDLVKRTGYRIILYLWCHSHAKQKKLRPHHCHMKCLSPNTVWVSMQWFSTTGNQPYPGLVECTELGELHLDYMHAVVKSLNNCLFWPTRFGDKCWYQHSDISAVIPKPSKEKGPLHHFGFSAAVWMAVMLKLQCW